MQPVVLKQGFEMYRTRAAFSPSSNITVTMESVHECKNPYIILQDYCD